MEGGSSSIITTTTATSASASAGAVAGDNFPSKWTGDGSANV